MRGDFVQRSAAERGHSREQGCDRDSYGNGEKDRRNSGAQKRIQNPRGEIYPLADGKRQKRIDEIGKKRYDNP